MNHTLSLPVPIQIKKLSLKLKLNAKIYWILLVVFLLSLLNFYIFQVNSLISESYSLEKNEKRLADLQKENKNLEVEFFRLNSLEKIEPLLAELGFEKIDQIYYIRVLESAVATK